MNISFRQLRAFVTISQLRSFTLAADRLHATQAGLSILIRDLEAAVGVRLIDRTTRSVTLSSAGDALLPVAERMLSDLETLLEAGHGLAAKRSGRIAFGMPPSLAATLLPPALKKFRSLYPNIIVIGRECLIEELTSRLYRHEIEFGIAFGVVNNLEFESTLLMQESLVIACAADHPLARKRRVKWRDIVDYPLVTMSREGTVRTLAEHALHGLGLALTPAYEVSNATTATELARIGLGVAIVSSLTGGTHETGHAVIRKLHDPVVNRPISLVTKKRAALSPAARSFVDLLREITARTSGGTDTKYKHSAAPAATTRRGR
ncbi:MAG TPA: LysR family transcriptional regulator [Burkholderiales bacterium]|nr:LysR family transcriptional regulator [Burkholderiales bacterium]